MHRRPEPRGGHVIGPEHQRFGLLLLVLGLLAVAALVAYLVARRTHRLQPLAAGSAPTYAGAGVDRALDTARYRYANGELSREAYLQLVGDLGGRVDPPAPPPPPPPPPTAPAP